MFIQLITEEASSCEILLWNCVGYDCLTRVKTTQSVCAVAWDPSTAYEYVSVGVAGLEFWMLEENKNSFDIRVHKPERQATPMVSCSVYISHCTTIIITAQYAYLLFFRLVL